MICAQVFQLYVSDVRIDTLCESAIPDDGNIKDFRGVGRRGRRFSIFLREKSKNNKKKIERTREIIIYKRNSKKHLPRLPAALKPLQIKDLDG